MRIIRFLDPNGQTHFGRQVDETTALRIEGDLAGHWRPTERQATIHKLLAPIVPTDILCIGLNYLQHAKESGSTPPQVPMLFIKARSSLANPFDPIAIPKLSREVDYEAELAVVIAKDAKNISRDDAMDHVLGYTCANDVSARWWQKHGSGGQFCRGKSFDTFCPLGPTVVPAAAVPDPQNLTLTTRVSGEEMQRASTSLMLFPVATLIHELSKGTTLLPGTAILTGTPAGVGAGRTPPRFLREGDTVEIAITGLGTLTNPVRLA